jgi:hypothetical protein
MAIKCVAAYGWLIHGSQAKDLGRVRSRLEHYRDKYHETDPPASLAMEEALRLLSGDAKPCYLPVTEELVEVKL